MRNATIVEYNNVTATCHATKRHMPGARYSTVEWSFMGKTIARKTSIFNRGKLTSSNYEVDPEFITPV